MSRVGAAARPAAGSSTRGWSTPRPGRSSFRRRSSAIAARSSCPTTSGRLPTPGHLVAAGPPGHPDRQGHRRADVRLDQHPVLPVRRRLHRLERRPAAARDVDAGACGRCRSCRTCSTSGSSPAGRTGPHDGLRDPDAGPGVQPEREVRGAGRGGRLRPGRSDRRRLHRAAARRLAGDQRLRHPDRLPHLRQRRTEPATARQPSGVDRKQGQWEVHYDPYDLSHGSGCATTGRRLDHRAWTHLPMVSAPFADFTWRHARALTSPAAAATTPTRPRSLASWTTCSPAPARPVPPRPAS